MEAIRIIRSMDLKNFQSHESTHLDFSRGFNVIVGNSDSGKTAILRALRWVFYNEPRGDFFIQHGKSDVEVRVTWDDGTTIRRYRSKRKNGYEIIYPNGDSQVFEGFNNTVPEEVVRYLRMWKVSFGPTTSQMLNIADQLEGPFLLSDTPRHRAAAIASLTHADELDEAATMVKRDVDRLQRELKHSHEECSRIEESIQALDYVDDALLSIQQVEDTLSLVEDLFSKRNEISGLVEELGRFQRTETTLQDEISRCGNPELVKGVLSDAEGVMKTYRLLCQAYEDFCDIETHKRNAIRGIEALRPVLRIEDYLHPLEELNYSLRQFLPLYENMEIGKHQQEILHYKLEAYQTLSVVQENIAAAEGLKTRWATLKDLSLEYDDVTKRIGLGGLHLKPLQRIGEIPEKVRQLERGIAQLKERKEALRQYQMISHERQEITSIIEKAEQQLSELQEEYLERLLEQGVCPTCLRPIDDTQKAEFIERLKEELQ